MTDPTPEPSKPKVAFEDVIANPDNGPRVAVERVCFSPDLAARYAELHEELTQAVWDEEQKKKPSEGPKTGRRLSERPKPTSQEIADRMEELVAANAASFYEIKLKALTRTEWIQLRAQHPPRDGVEADAGLFNDDTFPPAAVRACMIDPDPTDKNIAFLEEKLAKGEWDRLGGTAWALNEGARIAPKEGEALSNLNGSGAS